MYNYKNRDGESQEEYFGNAPRSKDVSVSEVDKLKKKIKKLKKKIKKLKKGTL